MSAETKAALAAAIEAHVASESDATAGAWVVLAETVSFAEFEPGRGASIHAQSGSYYARLGLLSLWKSQYLIDDTEEDE